MKCSTCGKEFSLEPDSKHTQIYQSIEGVTYYFCSGLCGMRTSPSKEVKVDGGGLRFNQGKPKLHLVPTSLKEAVARVFEYGMTREQNPYPENNWRRGMSWSTVIDSLMRHTEAYNSGEDLDPDSGLPHPYHMACNVAMLIEYISTCPELDDRFKLRKE